MTNFNSAKIEKLQIGLPLLLQSLIHYKRHLTHRTSKLKNSAISTERHKNANIKERITIIS